MLSAPTEREITSHHHNEFVEDQKMSDWREQPRDWLEVKSSGSSITKTAASIFQGEAAPVNKVGAPIESLTQLDGSSSMPAQAPAPARAPTTQQSNPNLNNNLNAVDVAEDVVNELLSLLDALQDVASGGKLEYGSRQRQTVESAAHNLPIQLNKLLSYTGTNTLQSSSAAAGRGVSSYSQQPAAPAMSRVSAQTSSASLYSSVSQPAAPPQAEPQQQQEPVRQESVRSSQPQDDGLDETERRLRAEAERQARIKREKLGKIGPAPNVNLMLSQAEINAKKRRNSSGGMPMQDDSRSLSRHTSQQDMVPAQQPESQPERQPEPVSQPAPPSYQQTQEELDEEELRLRRERERQQRIKMKTLQAFGAPPPKVNLLGSQAAPPPRNTSSSSSLNSSIQQSPSKVSGGSNDMDDLSEEEIQKVAKYDWKAAIKLKRQLESTAEERAALRAQEEEERRFANMPAWKAKLLKDKERKRWEAEAPMREAARREAERQAKFNALPVWKQKLILKKQQAAE